MGSRAPFTVHRGRVAPLRRNHVDTDQIIPKQFLKRIERSGFGPFLFNDWKRASTPPGRCRTPAFRS
jgi:3-isopropylmalate dehydratase small subunit